MAGNVNACPDVFAPGLMSVALVLFVRNGATLDAARLRGRLRELHERIEADGPFVAHATRLLVEARKP